MKKASLRDLNQIKTKHSRYFLSLAFLVVKLRETEVWLKGLGALDESVALGEHVPVDVRRQLPVQAFR